LRNIDRLILVWLYRLFPSLLDAIIIVKPETVLRWHRRGFCAHWRWKSWRHGGRPRIDRDVRDLIRRMSRENPLWGAPRIHGELLMLGIGVSESTVGRYMVRTRHSPSQGWKTSLRNHAAEIASIDLIVVRTISFKLLYGLVILRHARRQLVRIAVTANPTAEWIAGQVTEAFPWDEAPKQLLRDRDGAFGPAYVRRERAMGIRDRPIAARSPRQNGHVERPIGSVRRECLDHVVVFGEAQLRSILKTYAAYYNEVRTHLSLGKDAPTYRRSCTVGQIIALPVLGGLHQQYVRVQVLTKHNLANSRRERIGRILAIVAAGDALRVPCTIANRAHTRGFRAILRNVPKVGDLGVEVTGRRQVLSPVDRDRCQPVDTMGRLTSGG
jgi:transposase InsO family protein